MTIRRSAAVAVFALASFPVLATPPPAETEPRRERRAYDGSELVCRVLKIPGSRIGQQRTCLTRDQWRQQRQDQRDSIDAATRKKFGPGG
jgi:hypothetical protein